MITTYVRNTISWCTDGIVRKVIGLLAVSPLLIVVVWGYGHALYLVALLVGIPHEGAAVTAAFMTILTVGLIFALVLEAYLGE